VSQRDAMRMTDEEVDAFLDEGLRIHLASHNADGSIHLVPLSYMRLDGKLALWTDPDSRKIRNLRRDPRVTGLVEAGAEFAEFRAVQLVGRAEVVDDLDLSLRAGEVLTTRYSRVPPGDEVKAYVTGLAPQRVVVFLHAEQIVSWDHRKLFGVRPDKIGS
jgi:PPOX class probable F420-dependent enzyme